MLPDPVIDIRVLDFDLVLDVTLHTRWPSLQKWRPCTVFAAAGTDYLACTFATRYYHYRLLCRGKLTIAPCRLCAIVSPCLERVYRPLDRCRPGVQTLLCLRPAGKYVISSRPANRRYSLASPQTDGGAGVVK